MIFSEGVVTMKFNNPAADIYVPDGLDPEQALERTTVLSIAAHQDDCEIMAYHAIASCYGEENEWYAGIVLTDGGGSPRSGAFENYTNEQISVKRSQEQRDAAKVGKYSAMVQLAYSSEDVRKNKCDVIEDELVSILKIVHPDTMFIHNLFDRHETHLGACLRAIGALRKLPKNERPRQVYGMEVWRSLDWLSDEDRKLFDTSALPEVAQGVITAFDSQCTPKKRFDLAALGRRVGNATFQAPRDVDETNSCSIGMDLTPLIVNDSMDIREFALEYVKRFYSDVDGLLRKLTNVTGEIKCA
jgi:LmbE family N-acetylglucosaminyl deacetylase